MSENADYVVRSTNPATGHSTIVSGGPWTKEQAEKEVQRLAMEERTGSSKRLTPTLRFTVEPAQIDSSGGAE